MSLLGYSAAKPSSSPLLPYTFAAAERVGAKLVASKDGGVHVAVTPNRHGDQKGSSMKQHQIEAATEEVEAGGGSRARFALAPPIRQETGGGRRRVQFRAAELDTQRTVRGRDARVAALSVRDEGAIRRLGDPHLPTEARREQLRRGGALPLTLRTADEAGRRRRSAAATEATRATTERGFGACLASGDNGGYGRATDGREADYPRRGERLGACGSNCLVWLVRSATECLTLGQPVQ